MCPIKTNEKAREGNTSFRKWAPTQRREGNPQEGGYAAGVESIQSKVEQEGSGLQEGYLPRKKKETERIPDAYSQRIYTLAKHLVKPMENQANKNVKIIHFWKTQKLYRKGNMIRVPYSLDQLLMLLVY